MRETVVNLGEHFDRFVGDLVNSGRYESNSAVVIAGLRLLERHEATVSALNALLVEGEQSGPPEPFDFDSFVERKKRSKEY